MNRNITLIMENNQTLVFLAKDLISFEIEGIKKSMYDLDTVQQECEHFLVEVKNNIDQLEILKSSYIVAIQIENEELIYLPFERLIDKLPDESDNLYQEIYVSNHDYMYILVSITKNLSDSFNLEQINDINYPSYILKELD